MDEELLDLNTLGDEVAIAYLTDITDEDVLNIIPDASECTIYEVKTIVQDWAEIVAEVIDGRQKRDEEVSRMEGVTSAWIDNQIGRQARGVARDALDRMQHTAFNSDRGCK